MVSMNAIPLILAYLLLVDCDQIAGVQVWMEALKKVLGIQIKSLGKTMWHSA